MKALEYSKNNVLVFIDPKINIFRKNKKVHSLDFGSMVRISISDEGLLAVASGMEKTVIFNLNGEPPFKEEREIAGFWHISKSGSELFSINSSGLVAQDYTTGEIRVLQAGFKGNPYNLYLNDDGSRWVYINLKKKQVNYSLNGGVGTFNWNKGQLGEMTEKVLFDAEKQWVFIKHVYYKFHVITRIGFDNSAQSFKTKNTIFSLPLKIQDKIIIAYETSTSVSLNNSETIVNFYHFNPEKMEVGEKYTETPLINPGGLYFLPLTSGNIALLAYGKNPVIYETGFGDPVDQQSNEEPKKKKSARKKSMNIREQILDQYEDLIPDKIKFLYLEKTSLKKYTPEDINLCVIDFLKIAETSDYLVLCVQSNSKIENYPVGIYNPLFKSNKTIASSIKTWFPCYFLRVVNEILPDIWGQNYVWNKGKFVPMSELDFKNTDMYKKSLKVLNKIVLYKDWIMRFLKKFQNDKFMEVAETIFTILNEKDTINHPAWDYAKFLHIADGENSRIALYYELLQNDAPTDQWNELIQKYPTYNPPIQHLFSKKIPELEHSFHYFIRKAYLDYMDNDLEKIAKSIHRVIEKEKYEGSFKNLIHLLANDKNKKLLISEEYLKLGEYFESSGGFDKAMICYENSCYFQSEDRDNKSYNVKALNKLKALAEKQKDSNYLAWLAYYDKKTGFSEQKIEIVGFDEQFAHYILDLEDIDGLDLNNNHSFYSDVTVFPNFGFKDIYSIGGTGHNFLVYCIIPGAKPEKYPIAIYGEEEGVAKVVGSSIKTWFPGYLLHTINNLLKHLWSCAKNNYLDSANYTIKDLDSILAAKNEITEACEIFDNKEFNSILPVIFKVIEEKDKTDHPQWNYFEFYRLAEKDSYMGQFFDLKARNVPENEWIDFIKANPYFNHPLFLQFVEEWNLSYTEKRDISALNPELALEVTKRILAIDFGDSGDIYKILQKIAKFCNSDEYTPEMFYKLGKSLTKKKKYNEAIIAFWNAIYMYNVDSGAFYQEAFKEIIKFAKKLDDQHYRKYLQEYNEVVKQFIDDEEDED